MKLEIFKFLIAMSIGLLYHDTPILTILPEFVHASLKKITKFDTTVIQVRN